MDIAYISALSALAGSVVGGLTSGITAWLGLRAQARAGQLAHNKSQREDLYRDFIVAASQAYGKAVVSNEPQIQELVALYAMISRMRILSAPKIVACADKIMRATIDPYSPKQVDPRAARIGREWVGVRPAEGFQRDGARGATNVLTFPRG
jgi:hypothetical protein